MLSFVVIALLQAVAGDPAAPAEAADPAAQEQIVAANEASTEPAEPSAEQPRQMRRERRCTEVAVTGRRMPQRVFQNVMVPVEPDQPAD